MLPGNLRSLTLASDISVLPVDRVVEHRDGYLVVRSPGNPAFYWGNFLVFTDPPGPGDGALWEAVFEREFADEPRVRHRLFAWDRPDGAIGSAREELEPRGYAIEESCALTATPEQLRPHSRANSSVRVEILDPSQPLDGGRWAEVVELEVASRDEASDESGYRTFTTTRLHDIRAIVTMHAGAWYVAIEPESDAVVASCGIVVQDGVGRFQLVATADAFRRRGICSRLVVDAARHAAATSGAERFVIVADAGYHALGLYESLGFARTEHVVAACRRPDT